jgi:hypothetical protein
MRRNRIISLFAFAVLSVFFGILLYRVGRVDLGAVILITLALAAYDLWSQLFRRLFGRARHLHHPEVAADRARRGGRHLHR